MNGCQGSNSAEKPSASCVGVVVDATDKTSAKANSTRAIATVLHKNPYRKTDRSGNGISGYPINTSVLATNDIRIILGFATYKNSGKLTRALHKDAQIKGQNTTKASGCYC